MRLLENEESFFTKVIEGIFRFLVSPAAPWVFLAIGLVVLFFILRALYRKLRDKHLYQITYERSFSEKGVYAGDEVELIETITNHGFFPLIHVDVEAYLYNELRLTGYDPPKKDGMQYFSGRFNLWPYMRIKRKHKLVCLKRGYYAIESAAIPMRDSDYFIACPAEIYVYPKPVPISAVLEASGRMQGDQRAVRQLFSDPFTLSGVRDYRFGDTVSSINFKVSARTWMCSGASTSPLKVNDREFCANRRLAVFMDFHTERDCGFDGISYNRRVDVGLSYASALIREAIYGGFNTAFYCNCKQEDGAMSLEFPLASGESHMLDIFRAMAKIRGADGASFTGMLESAIEDGVTDCEIVAIVLCTSEKTEDRLAMLRQMGNSVRLIVLNEEDEKNAI